MLRFLLGAVLAVLAAYGAAEAWPLVAGPGLSIDSPENGASYPGGIVGVSGTAKRAAALTLDGAPLLHSEDGGFSAALAFPRGGSILTFTATDRFGRTVAATRTIFVP